MSKLAETEEEPRGGKPSAAALAAAGAKAWAEMQPDGAASLERLASLAAGGDAVAMCDLGILHQRGERGAPKSLELAADWFRRSAEAGDGRGAANWASRFAAACQGPVESIKWYRAAKDATPGGGKIWDKHKLRVVA
ncbi:hypothetical protein JL722_13253 [Aureococcus anophagefferens]|nr:hypothetical protein JL722_13253 [Aureococcus anophagefferens]